MYGLFTYVSFRKSKSLYDTHMYGLFIYVSIHISKSLYDMRMYVSLYICHFSYFQVNLWHEYVCVAL